MVCIINHELVTHYPDCVLVFNLLIVGKHKFEIRFVSMHIYALIHFVQSEKCNYFGSILEIQGSVAISPQQPDDRSIDARLT